MGYDEGMGDGTSDPDSGDGGFPASSRDSRPTVLVAGAANLVIGVAKLVVGSVSGSAAMLAEAAHSFADTLNEGFLLTALQRSGKAPDRDHPFGYGMERYFWSLLAAVGVFVLGGGFGIYQGLERLLGGAHEVGSPRWSYVVLGVAFLMEGGSLVRAVWQLRREAVERGSGMGRHLLRDADPALRAVVSEDSVALLGVLLAAGGLALEEATGQAAWDGVASILIGLLLVAVAVGLGRQNQQYLIGKAVDRGTEEAIAQELREGDGIDGVHEVLTMRLGPDQVLVTARIDLAEGRSGSEFEQIAEDLDERIQRRFPEVRHVFLDPTPPGGRTEARTSPPG
jgi:cation diffusion facilitator family transporter